MKFRPLIFIGLLLLLSIHLLAYNYERLDSTVTDIYKIIHLQEKSVPWDIYVMEIDLTQSGIRLKTGLANNKVAYMDGGGTNYSQKETLAAMINRRTTAGENIIAGINADFFDMTQGWQFNITATSGRIASTGITSTHHSDHYGGPDAVNTGWVSKVLFEPSIGNSILKSMPAAEKNLSLRFETKLKSLEKTKTGWRVQFISGETNFSIEASVLIDATELGDVAKMAGVPYDIGMDSRLISHEEIAPLVANDIVQDLTYVAVLKDFGPDADKTIPKPENYDATLFYCTCAGKCSPDSVKHPLWDCNRMMQYGKLPNEKYMINWPFAANDYYVNVVDMSPTQRDSAFGVAKLHTLRYVYYLQNELGFKNLGIAYDEFPNADGLPFFPYHRESRHIQGKIRFTINDLARPFEQNTALYRTGIAVGDYPVDHHHDAYPD